MNSTALRYPAISCRIICIGTSLSVSDNAGPRVYQTLANRAIPPDVMVFDGGLGGLNLLNLLENVHQVIFVDQVSGFRKDAGIVVIELPNPAVDPGEYGHDAGIGYLMNIAPHILDSPLPHCLLIGIEGDANPATCEEAAELCLYLAHSTIECHCIKSPI